MNPNRCRGYDELGIMARSVDGGKTFVNHKIDTPAFKCDNNVFFGDYTGISAYGGRVIPMFMHFDEKKKLVVRAGAVSFQAEEPRADGIGLGFVRAFLCGSYYSHSSCHCC